jgi:hypothetical protein
MTEANWDPHRCNEKSGFLFDHACKYGPVANCGRCERPVCNDHLRDDDNGQPVCITCAKKELKDLGRNQNVRKRGFGRHSRWHDHDPYFYGGYHYGGWGHYGHGYWGHQNYQHAMHRDDADFTEADSSGLDDGDAADFESDMSES